VLRPIGIDLFAGVGGLGLGFEQAGFDVCAAVEIDPVHCAVHQFNFPNCVVLPHSISTLSGRYIRRAAGLGERQIDVVFGGPPCQGFSLIGQRALSDPRNSLVREFVRVVAELRAHYFVFENVKGLTVGKHRRFLDEVIEAFGKQGYRVRFPWKVLDAAMFGVPQHRERLILLGARQGFPLPEYPEALYHPADCGVRNGLPCGPTCAEAIGDLPDADDFDELIESDEVEVGRWGSKGRYARQMRCADAAAWHFGYKREWNSAILSSSLRTEHTDISRRRFLATMPGETEPISRFYKLAADGVCNTLRAGTDSSRGAFTSPRPIHYEYPRCVTVREMARLHGYPDWFRFHRTKWHGARQIGNSVPPPLARAVASQVMVALGATPARPEERLELGDPALLGFDMSEASAYFRVKNPIARRNRKSGARKRNQLEIEFAAS